MQPIYQRSVDRSTVQSLIEGNKRLTHIPESMALAERITAAYRALGISQAEAGRRAGMSAQRFGNYATGKRSPDLKALVAIAEALQTTPDALLGVNDSPFTDQEAGIADILGKLLELEGLDQTRARNVAEAAAAAHRLLKALPEDGDEATRRRIAAQAVWIARQGQ